VDIICDKISSMNTKQTLEDLYRPIQDRLVDVRAVIGQLWEDAMRLVRVDVGPIPKAGGKLLRPALCLLSAGAIGGKDLREFVNLSVAFEALHIASLAHDDVIDRAILRRGGSSLNALWDNHAAVLGGDYLMARAVQMLAAYDSCTVVDRAVNSVRRMAEGELLFFGREIDSVKNEECIVLAEHKTASLFSEACSAATYVVDPTHREALRRFGTTLGIAFQITDDVLDVTESTANLGKPACGDIAEGKVTLPILFMREAMSPEERARLDAMRDTRLSDEDRAWVTERAEHTGARERTEAEARRYADEALAALMELPKNIYRDSMEGITEFVLIRNM
jgi:octaprenyl-diphosphate synthase